MALSFKERMAALKQSTATAPATEQAEQAKEAEQAPKQAEEKPLSFAERLALKNKAAEQAPEKAVEVEEQSSDNVLDSVLIPPVQSAPATMSFAEKMRAQSSAIKQTQEAAKKEKPPLVIEPSRLPDDPSTAQALVDISTRIYELDELIDEDLKGAMSELKKALLDNPSACELLLDSDIGNMVASLRRMEHLASYAAKQAKPAAKGSKTKPKSKDVELSVEQLAQVWEEL